MHLLGLLLILINVGAVVGPLVGVVVIYNGNIQEMIIPPEVQNAVARTLGVASPISSGPDSSTPVNPAGDSSSVGFALPQYVSSSYNLEARTITAVFNFTNPLNFTLTINSVSADVKCHAHGFFLGHAGMPSAVGVPPAQTVELTVVFVWSEPAQNHIVSDHPGEATINVDLVNIALNVSGITIETPSAYNVDIPLC